MSWNRKNHVRSALLLVCLVSSLELASMVIAQEKAAQPADKYADKLRIFEEFVRTQMEKDKIPGLTIGFYKDDYTWVKGFGYADLENNVPARAESAYRLTSITKTFTSADRKSTHLNSSHLG